MSKTIVSRHKHQDGIVVYGIDSASSRQVIGLSGTVTQGEYRFDSLPDTTDTSCAGPEHQRSCGRYATRSGHALPPSVLPGHHSGWC